MNIFYESVRDTDGRLYYKVQSDNYCYPHMHQDIELVYVLEGSKTVTVNDTTVTLTEDQFALSDSFDIHSIHEGAENRHLVVIFPNQYLTPYYTYKKQTVLSSNFFLDRAVNRKLLANLEEIGQSAGRNDLLIASLINAFMARVIELAPLTQRDLSKDSVLVRDILMYISDNFRNDISSEQVARHFGYNKQYFSGLFHKLFRMSFPSFLNHMRFKYILDKVEGGSDMNITTLAYEAGFKSIQSFNRNFKEVYGEAPSLFLKRYHEKHVE